MILIVILGIENGSSLIETVSIVRPSRADLIGAMRLKMVLLPVGDVRLAVDSGSVCLIAAAVGYAVH